MAKSSQFNLRDHVPLPITKFGGLYDRGDKDDTPIDHFYDCNNIRFSGEQKFDSRYGTDISQDVGVPLSNVKRIYNYPTPDGNTLIVLTYINESGLGSIYHVKNSTTVFGPILVIFGMTDFAFIPYNGRGYISPFTSFTVNGQVIEKGLQDQFLYVYRGDGTLATPAAGAAPTGTMTIANGAAGHTDAGDHVFGVVFEYDTGYETAPGALQKFTTVSGQSVSFGNVPVATQQQFQQGSPFIQFLSDVDDSDYEDELIFPNFNQNYAQIFTDEIEPETRAQFLVTYPNATFITVANPHVVKRHIVASKVIPNFNGDLQGNTLYFIPTGVIDNNTDTFINDVSFYDADLLDDASHLFNNYSSIPAGAVLTLYHDRLVLAATFTDISLALVSAVQEPEAINQITGLIIAPLDGNPISNAQELRDVLYLMKRARTVSYSDNGGDPSTWPLVVVDNALGSPVHGIGTVLDSGSSSVDFLIVATFQGISLFNGKYITPELTLKIENFWKNLDRTKFNRIQILNAASQKEIYVILPDRTLLVGNYALGMDSKNIRWTPQSFVYGVNTVSIWNIDEIIIGADYLG